MTRLAIIAALVAAGLAGFTGGRFAAPKVVYSEVIVSGPAFMTNGGITAKDAQIDFLDPDAMCWEKGKGLLFIGPPYHISVVKEPMINADSIYQMSPTGGAITKTLKEKP